MRSDESSPLPLAVGVTALVAVAVLVIVLGGGTLAGLLGRKNGRLEN
jgi:hypothetical protein